MGAVWLLSVGEYSDRRVVAAFSSEERANEAKDRIAVFLRDRDRDSLDVERLDVDPDLSGFVQGGRIFTFWFDADGNVERSEEEDHAFALMPEDIPGPSTYWLGDGRLHVEKIAPSREIALKAARDARAQSLAEREGLA